MCYNFDQFSGEWPTYILKNYSCWLRPNLIHLDKLHPPPPPHPDTHTNAGKPFLIVMIMEICKAPTLRLKAQNKHTYIMYIEMEKVIQKKKNVYIDKCSNIIMQKMHTHTHACTHTCAHMHTHTHTQNYFNFYFLHMLLILVSVTLLFTWNKTHPKLCPFCKSVMSKFRYLVMVCWKICANDKMFSVTSWQ